MLVICAGKALFGIVEYVVAGFFSDLAPVCVAAEIVYLFQRRAAVEGALVYVADAFRYGYALKRYAAGKRLGRQRVVLEEIAANAVTPAMSAALPENRDCYMVRLELYVGGRRVSVNDYLRSPGRDFTALNRLAQVRLRARRVARQDDGRATTVRFEVSNPSATTALAVKFNVRDGRTGEAILPAYISEGYIHLLPGEKRTVEAEYVSCGGAVLSAEGYNLERHTLLEL